MFSLVIPTHNRSSILNRCLTHLLTLDEIQECEVILVDDGSSDETPAIIRKFCSVAPNIFRVITTTNGGPARARNLGVQSAKHERILFVDDDVFPRSGMFQSHQHLLDAGFTGSQGLLVWHQEIKITPLIEYIDSRGSQFAFDKVKDPGNLDFAHVYSGNFAVLRSAVLNAGGFDEKIFNTRLALAAFEDTVLGYKLVKNGAKLCLNREAIADHLHDMTEESYFQREYKVGYLIGELRHRYPELARSLGWNKKDLWAQEQAHLLELINSSSVGRKLFGYSLSMRLRNREAFYRGFVQFKREAACGIAPQAQ